MKLNYLLLIGLIFSACNWNNEYAKTSKQALAEMKEVNPSKGKIPDSIAYFPTALTYKYIKNGEENELWFYLNEETQQVLYIPNDDMLQGVISYPNGEYRIFGTDENGKKMVLTQKVDAVVGEEILDAALVPTHKTKSIDQKNIQQKNIECTGYKIKYLKMEGQEILFTTNEIPINSFQLYGFCRLEGDAKLPIDMDYINLLKKQQTLTHIERANFSLELLNYGPNPYEFLLTEF